MYMQAQYTYIHVYTVYTQHVHHHNGVMPVRRIRLDADQLDADQLDADQLDADQLDYCIFYMALLLNYLTAF